MQKNLERADTRFGKKMLTGRPGNFRFVCIFLTFFVILGMTMNSPASVFADETSPEELQKDLQRYTSMVAEYPGNYLYRNSLGETLFLLKNYEKALDHFRQVAKLTPHSKDEVTSYNTALSLYKLHRYDEALKEFSKAAEACDFNASAKAITLGDVYGEYFAAVCLYRTGKFKDALQALTALIDERSVTFERYLHETTFASQTFEKTDEGLLWNGVLLFEDKAHFESFVQAKVRIGKIGLNYFGAYVIRALCKNRLKDSVGAMQDLEAALAVNPDSGLANFLKGKWLVIDKRKDEGERYLKIAEDKGFKGVKDALPEELEMIMPLSYSPTLYF